MNLTPGNILTGSFLLNLRRRAALRPQLPQSERSHHQSPADALHEHAAGPVVFRRRRAAGRRLRRYARHRCAICRKATRLFEITPQGNRGNYFSGLDRHFYRQQWIANLFLPALHWHGAHQLKFGIDFEREAFHQQVMRHDYEVLRDDNSVARYVTFAGSPFQARKNFEGAQYMQDAWSLRDGLLVEAGLRAEWNEIVRDLEVAPRFAVAWAPKRLRGHEVLGRLGRLLRCHQPRHHLAPAGPDQPRDILSRRRAP